MGFKLTKADLKKSALCTPGMHSFTLVKVNEPYLKEGKNGPTTVQQCDFESAEGYVVPVWFNTVVMSNLFEFVAAADNVVFDMEKFEDVDIELKDYVGKKVAASVSHRVDNNNKPQAQIDNFYSADKVPF
jgi:hypothetical protein